FTVRIHTENQDQASFCPSAPREVSVLPELALGHLRYSLTGVPPQSNSTPATVPREGRASRPPRVSEETIRVVVFHRRSRRASHLFYTPHVSSQCQTRVKLNRVFFPR